MDAVTAAGAAAITYNVGIVNTEHQKALGEMHSFAYMRTVAICAKTSFTCTSMQQPHSQSVELSCALPSMDGTPLLFVLQMQWPTIVRFKFYVVSFSEIAFDWCLLLNHRFVCRGVAGENSKFYVL